MRMLLVPLVIAMASAVAVFAETSSYAQTWTPLDSARVMEQAKTIVPDRYPDSDMVVVDGQTVIRYQAGGAYYQWFEQYVKVLTEKGKRNMRTLTSSFSIPYNATKFTLVEVIGKDGTVRKVDIRKNSREMIDQSQMDSNIYDPNDKMIRLTIPELEIGDTVHYMIEDEFFKSRMAGTFNDYQNFEGTDPIKRTSYTVIAPRSKPLKSIALKSEIPGTVSFRKSLTKDEIIYQWVAQDVPRAFEEPEMPPLFTQSQRLLVSTVPDWKTVSRWYWELSKPHLAKVIPEMGTTVDGLIKGIKERDREIEAIFRWVSQEVRYLGITAETEAPGYEPHDVCMTFERKAGVCRDKAALLTAMLRHAGFEAYPVLIMNGPKKDPEVPQPYFNHAIVGVRNPDGTYTLMDPTDESTRELLPSYLNNMSYLVATPRGETLLTSPIVPAEENMMHITTTGSLDAKGTLQADTTFEFGGINENAFRAYFARISDQERRTYFEKMLRVQIPGARLTSMVIAPRNVMDTSRRLQAFISFTAEDLLVHSKTVDLFPAFRFGDSIGIVNHLIQKMGLKERKYTYRTDFSAGVDETLNIDVDPSLGKPLNLPISESADDEGSSWKRTVTLEDGTLRATNFFTMKLPEYSPEQYKHVQETLKKIEKANRVRPAFSGNAPARAQGNAWYDIFRPEAVVLDERFDYDILSDHEWTETRHIKIKILTYAGKKRHGDLKIPYNPAWDDIEVKKVMVTDPSGQVREIQKNEINIMDKRWVGYAARYPAGKIMVISMPGLREGSVIDYTLVLRKKNRQCFFLEGVLQGIDPIESARISIRMPEAMTVKFGKNDAGYGMSDSWKPFPDGVIMEKKYRDGDRKALEFIAKCVPPVQKEENLPPDFSFKPTVFVSSGKMGLFSREMDEVLKKAASSGGEVRRKALAITSSAKDADGRLLRIRNFVAENIQDVDIDVYEMPLNMISTADTTLADGYGHSADKAVLIYAMCEAAGFAPEFVLTTDGPSIPALHGPISQYPSPAWFNKVLVRVKVDGRSVFLGDTDQYASLGSTPRSGKLMLALDTGRVQAVSARGPEYEDRVEENVSVDLSREGDAVLKITRNRYGMEYARFVKDWKELPPEERKRRFQEILFSLSKDAAALTPYTVSLDGYPCTESYTVRIPNYAVRQGDRMTMDLPSIARSIGTVTTTERFNPLCRDVYNRRHTKIDLLLPQGVKSIDLMPPRSVKYTVIGSGDITLETRVLPPEGGNGKGRMRIEMDQVIDLKPFIALPGEYARLLEANRAISRPDAHMLLLNMEEQKAEGQMETQVPASVAQ